MIDSKIYNIKSPILKPYVEYVLFNQATCLGSSATSFANSNICLGILKDSKMLDNGDSTFANKAQIGIHSYLSGMYLKPHQFTTACSLDEICIDFTPLGYYQFFDMPIKKYIISGNPLLEGFGESAQFFFESVFFENEIEQRGMMIETFLLSKIKSFDNIFIKESYHLLDAAGHCKIARILKSLNCSERKLQRSFTDLYDITPKQFLRIKRFRNTLGKIQQINRGSGLSLLAYEDGYSDQSHLNKEFKSFTNQTPLQLRQSLIQIDDTVMVSV